MTFYSLGDEDGGLRLVMARVMIAGAGGIAVWQSLQDYAIFVETRSQIHYVREVADFCEI